MDCPQPPFLKDFPRLSSFPVTVGTEITFALPPHIFPYQLFSGKILIDNEFIKKKFRDLYKLHLTI